MTIVFKTTTGKFVISEYIYLIIYACWFKLYNVYSFKINVILRMTPLIIELRHLDSEYLLFYKIICKFIFGTLILLFINFKTTFIKGQLYIV